MEILAIEELRPLSRALRCGTACAVAAIVLSSCSQTSSTTETGGTATLVEPTAMTTSSSTSSTRLRLTTSTTFESSAVIASSTGLRWSRVPDTEGFFAGANIDDVVAEGSRLVAVGETNNGAIASWVSTDGRTWIRNISDLDGSMHGVTAGGPGFVAVGRSGTAAAVWGSLDGLRWTRASHDAEIFGDDNSGDPAAFSMGAVTAFGDRLVAVGGFGSGLLGPIEAAVWTSSDGRSWSRVTPDSATFGGAVMSDIAVAGPGLVAVGFDGVNSEAWTTADGLSWARVPHSLAFGGTRMQAVAAGSSGIVAVGSDARGGVAAVWTSSDGTSWTRVLPEGAPFAGLMCDVVATDDGFYAVGGEIGDGTMRGAAWWSPDGVEWTPIPDPNAVFEDGGMCAVATTESGVVAAGLDPATGAAAIWVGEP